MFDVELGSRVERVKVDKRYVLFYKAVDEFVEVC